MSGRPCRCLDTVTELAWELGDSSLDDATKASTLRQKILLITNRCLNAVGISSYFDRVWTRHKLMYSSIIRVVWTAGEDTIECVRELEDIHHLSGFAALKFQSYPDLGQAPAKALDSVRTACSTYFSRALQALAEYGGFVYDTGYMGKEGLVNSMEFALGTAIRSGWHSPSDDESMQQKTARFIGQLGRLGSTSRAATKPCDYVASVWVDCPGIRAAGAVQSHEVIRTTR
jgi:hypothetical protein